jgi:hypothetical protein
MLKKVFSITMLKKRLKVKDFKIFDRLIEIPLVAPRPFRLEFLDQKNAKVSKFKLKIENCNFFLNNFVTTKF